MSGIAVVTDSASCIPAELVRQYNIHVIPFRLAWDRQVFRDGVDLSAAEFYSRLRQNDMRPTTSQPSVGELAALYESLSDEADGIVSIHIPREISNTCQSAEYAAQHFSRVPTRVIDSRTATIAQGFVVLAAARVAAAGGTLDEVVAAAEATIPRVWLYATLQSLEPLRRGGRIGAAISLVSAKLSVYPVLYLAEGRVCVAAVTRVRHKALERIVELVAQQVGDHPVRASVFHGDDAETAKQLAVEVQARFSCVEFYITEFTPVMGAHTGPGVIGVAYCIV